MSTAFNWNKIRNDFPASRTPVINLASMVIGSTPDTVQKAVANHRGALDAAPWQHLLEVGDQPERDVAEAVGKYFGVSSQGVALTSGTTQGLALLYGGINLRPGQEILTTAHEFSGALRIMDWRFRRDGTPVRRLVLVPDPSHPPPYLVETLESEIRPNTRVLALTWVYSSSGLRLPIEAISQMVGRVNRTRTAADRVLLCVDGVHGFGVEGTTFPALGCAAFVAGCHKWVCGPRGTGIWCGTRELWNEMRQLIPTSAAPDNLGLSFSPGGVQAYDHVWAMADAFTFLTKLGPEHVRARIHFLASLAKESLGKLAPRVRLITPVDPAWSSGIVCFDVDGKTADDVVDRLQAKDVLASVSSVDEGRPGKRHVRFSFAMFNNEADIAAAVAAVALL